jgi:hypothetical protein
MILVPVHSDSFPRPQLFEHSLNIVVNPPESQAPVLISWSDCTLSFSAPFTHSLSVSGHSYGSEYEAEISRRLPIGEVDGAFSGQTVTESVIEDIFNSQFSNVGGTRS